MSAPTPETPTFPTYRLQDFLPFFGLGWLLGAAVVLLVRWGGQHLLGACQGRTLLALMVPLILGPGGLAFTAISWRIPRRAALGLGLVIASFFPALFVGAVDIGQLRSQGCAGGYIVISAPGKKSLGSIIIPAGQTRELTGRIGGYTTQTHPGSFMLQAQSSQPSIKLTLSKTQVQAGETFGIQVNTAASTPINTFMVGVQATQETAGQTDTAVGTLEIDVRPSQR